MQDLRIGSRHRTTGGVLYSYDGHQAILDTYSGLLSDLSETGACIYTQEAVEEGSILCIYGRSLGFREPKSASVIWCKRIHDDLYRVGLVFPQA